MDFIKSGQFISELRKEKCMTQADLGTILGVTDKTVSKWERGVNIPDILMIREIAKVFNVTTDEILNAERDKTEVSTILKFYRNKKLRYALAGICGAFILFTLVLLVYFTNNYDKSKVYKFYNVTDDYEISGYIYGIGNNVRVVLDDLELENIKEYEKLKITSYTIKTNLNGIIVYDYSFDVDDDEYISFSTIVNEMKKLSVSVQNINTNLELYEGYIYVKIVGSEQKFYEIKLEFDCSIDLRNNRFFYN